MRGHGADNGGCITIVNSNATVDGMVLLECQAGPPLCLLAQVAPAAQPCAPAWLLVLQAAQRTAPACTDSGRR